MGRNINHATIKRRIRKKANTAKIVRDAFKKKKNVFKDIVPIRSDTPPP